MIGAILRRILTMAVTFLIISALVFFILRQLQIVTIETRFVFMTIVTVIFGFWFIR